MRISDWSSTCALPISRGTGIMNRLFEKYGPYKGQIAGRPNGVLISNSTGEAVGYALGYLEERGILMVSPGEPVYEGMVIGENAKSDDLEVNPLKSKQLTNFRASGKDDALRLTPPKRSEEHTSELQSLMRFSYAVFCLHKKII